MTSLSLKGPHQSRTTSDIVAIVHRRRRRSYQGRGTSRPISTGVISLISGSSGIHDRKSLFGSTRIISITLRIFCGWTIRNNWWLRGARQVEYTCAWRTDIVLSGDGTLSVMDVRSKNIKPIAQSEDQEDELLSIVGFKGYVSF